MTESRRALVRIASNLVRLFGTVLMGLLIVRFLVRAVGSDAYGLVSLLGSTMGLATVIEESVENSMVRELGRAHHSGDASEFRRMFNSALAVSGCAGLCSIGMYLVIGLVLPMLSISPDLLGAARWFLAAKAIESMTIITLSPAYNMYMVTERMAALNAWMIARRACALIGAVATLWARQASPASGLILYAWVTAGCHVLVLASAVGWIMLWDHRTRPSPRLADRAACAEIVRTSGTNATIYATQLLQLPACSILMNISFGLQGNFIFGMAVQLAGYVRMVASGFVAGVEAVTTRISSENRGNGHRDRLQALAYHATRLQAFVAAPAAAAMFVIAPSFLRVWIAGEGVSDQTLAWMTIVGRIAIIGILAQCLLDVWWRLLYGTGFVLDYARPFTLIAVCTPPVALVMLNALPGDVALCGPIGAYASLNLLLVCGFMPRIMARRFVISATQLLTIIGRPCLPASIAAIVLYLFDRACAPPTVLSLALGACVFGLTYAASAYPLALETRDRQRVGHIRTRLNRLLGGRGAS